MTAKDRYTISVKCPKCGRSGTAHVWENDGWSFMRGDQSTHVDSLPEGFTAERAKNGIGLMFKCVQCRVDAMQT